MWQVTTMLWRRSWWHQQTPTSATPSLGRQCSQLLPTATLRQCCAWCSMEPPGATKLTVMSSRPSVASPPSSKHTCLPPITRVQVIYLPSPLVIAHDQLPCHCMLHCLVHVALPGACCIAWCMLLCLMLARFLFLVRTRTQETPA